MVNNAKFTEYTKEQPENHDLYGYPALELHVTLPGRPVLDMHGTGKRIRELCDAGGVTVKDIQEKLYISSFQSVYAWFSGRTLPKLENMYLLGQLLGVSIEDMIVMTSSAGTLCLQIDHPATGRRLWQKLSVYYNRILFSTE